MLSVTEAELARLAREAREEAGATQEEVARRLGVKQPTVAQAEREPKRKLTKLRISIIHTFGSLQVEGPYWVVSKREQNTPPPVPSTMEEIRVEKTPRSASAQVALTQEPASVAEQLALFKSEKSSFSDPSFARNKTLPIHRWVPWVAGYSSDFVRDVVSARLTRPGTVIDPFAGVGTTLVEAALLGHEVVGFEINPYAALASRVKLEAAAIDARALEEAIKQLAAFYEARVHSEYEPVSTAPEGFRTRRGFYSPIILRKVLIVQDYIAEVESSALARIFRLAFAATMVKYSNYSYEPSLGTRKGAGKEDIADFPVIASILEKLREMAADVVWIQQQTHQGGLRGRIVSASFFDCQEHVEPESADLLVTSPPYLNNYHYIRNTRPHLYWLGFVEKPKDTKSLEHANYGKYWQTVRDGEEVSLSFDLPDSDLPEKLSRLRALNPEKGVYGGNGWANYAATYFNDSYRFAEATRYVLRPGGSAFVVVGNSILQGINFQIDRYIGQIAEVAGLELAEITIPRETRVGNSIIQSDVRVTKAKKNHALYEAVVELRKPRT